MDWNAIWQALMSWVTNTGVKILIAIVLLLVTFRVTTVLTRSLEKKLL